MKPIMIPKKQYQNDDLVIIPKKEYEELLSRAAKREGSELDRSLQQALNDVRQGEVSQVYRSVDELMSSL